MNGARLGFVVVSFSLSALATAACDRNKDGAGLVPDAAAVTTTDAPEAGAPAAIDPSQCPGCQLAAAPAWTFEGIYSDDKCTVPLAQAVVPACAAVTALGPTTITYVDAIQSRAAGSSAQITLVDQVGGGTARFRKAGTTCVRANEAAVDLTPVGCANQKVCRDTNGALACANCRTFANGCPDFEETRIYATINDPQLGGAKGAGGGDALAKLRRCCEAIAAEAKKQGNSPELTAAGAQCFALVAAAGPNGNAPELGAVKAMLQGRNLPAMCAGL